MSNGELKVLVCFGAHNEWYGRLVRRILGGTYNHCFLAYKSLDWDKWMCVEVLDKVCLLTFDDACKRYSKMEIYESSCNLFKGMQAMVGYIGSDYDTKGVIWGLIKVFLWKFFKIEMIKPFQDTSRLFCSEYVAEVLKRSNVPDTSFWQTSNISPKMLKQFVTANPKFVRVNFVN